MLAVFLLFIVYSWFLFNLIGLRTNALSMFAIMKVNNLFKYINLLLKKWVIYLGLLPSFYGLIAAYIPVYELPQIPQRILYIIIILFFLVANYQIWQDVSDENVKIKKSLENRVNYEITLKLEKIVLDECKLREIIDKNILEIPHRLEEATFLKNNYQSNDAQVKFNLVSNIEEEQKKFESTLNDYICNLQKYELNVEGKIDVWRDHFKTCLYNLYFASFYIKNTGYVYDESIDVTVYINDKNEIVRSKEIYNSLPNNLNLPEKPNFKMNYFDGCINDSLVDFYSQTDFYQNEEINSNYIKITLRELKASEGCSLLRKCIFIKMNSKSGIHFKILSKNSRYEINKNVNIEVVGESTLPNSFYI